MAAFDSTLSDPYISTLLSASLEFLKQQSSPYHPMSSFKTGTTTPASDSGQGPNLIQFLESVPPPITLLLVELAPVISWLRWAAEVVSWKSHWTDPWLTLALWWALCLGTDVILRYFLPLALLLPALLPYLSFRRGAGQQKPPTTEYSISSSLSDITTLRELLPTVPVLPHLPFPTALRISALLFLPYAITTHFVPMPILSGIAGTLFMTYRAPWACILRKVLGRSAYVQRFLLRVWFILSGSEDSSYEHFSTTLNTTTNSMLDSSPYTSASTSASPPARFIFTILECQRWWMGLDWTAALLPGERPSWCGLSHHPVLPPSVFTLPPPTTVFLPAPNGRRIKKAATWRWEEFEWGLLINKDGTGVKRVERKPPGLEEGEGGSRMATRAASMLKERTASIGSSSEATSGKEDKDSGTGAGNGAGGGQGLREELHTDTDGWIYGDNKWEAASAKGGLGKYTRYRRWTRIAVLEETVEEVGPGELGIIKDTMHHARSASEERPEEEKSRPDGKETFVTKVPDSPEKGRESLDSRGSCEERGSVLRERLKSAVKGVRIASC